VIILYHIILKKSSLFINILDIFLRGLYKRAYSGVICLAAPGIIYGIMDFFRELFTKNFREDT